MIYFFGGGFFWIPQRKKIYIYDPKIFSEHLILYVTVQVCNESVCVCVCMLALLIKMQNKYLWFKNTFF